MNYYSHHIGDYRRDTAHLSLLEHGVYRQLIDMYYLSEQSIQEETDLVMRRLCARTKEEKEAVLSVLKEFFLLDEGWIHKRCNIEIFAYKNKARRAQDNGKLGGRPPKTKVVISGLPNETETKANHKPRTKNQEPRTINNNTLVPTERDKVPVQEIVNLFNKSFETLPEVKILSDKRRAALRKRWLENEGMQSIERWENFFNYIKKSDWLMGNVAGRDGKYFCLTFDWLFNPTNFIKIYEGNYHGGQQ